MSDSNTIIALKRLGIGENEATLYEILLTNPQASIPVLQKKSPFSRTMLYYILDNLEKLNLISISKKGRHKVYEAKSPVKLEEMLENKKTELQQQSNLIEGILPDLQSMYRLAHNKPNIRFFEGKKGIRKALDETYNSKSKKYCSITDTEAIVKYVKDINDEYYSTKQNKGFEGRTLTIDTPDARKLWSSPDLNTSPETIRFLPKGVAPYKTVVQIYDNRVTYMSIRENNKMAVIIEDKDITAMHQNIFEFLWKIAGPVTNDKQMSNSDEQK